MHNRTPHSRPAAAPLSRPRRRRAASGAILLLTALLHARSLAADPAQTTRTEDMSCPPVTLTFTLTPAVVRLDRDVLLTIRIEAPSEMSVEIPPLSDRLSGFTQNGIYRKGPFHEGGRTTVEHHARLTPDIAQEYRIAPMAIRYTDNSESPPRSGWFPTRAVVLEADAPFKGDPGDEIGVALEPVWIHPTLRTIVLSLLTAVGLLGIMVGLLRLAKRAHSHIQLMRMSPRERAMKELDLLLDRQLVEKGMVKEFYLRLTMIVRSYIERQHAVRAPEQTTEEFLAAVTADQRFSPRVVARLKTFLQAADLVKFAAHRPDTMDIAGATESARDYIRSDTDASASTTPGPNTAIRNPKAES